MDWYEVVRPSHRWIPNILHYNRSKCVISSDGRKIAYLATPTRSRSRGRKSHSKTNEATYDNIDELLSKVTANLEDLIIYGNRHNLSPILKYNEEKTPNDEYLYPCDESLNIKGQYTDLIQEALVNPHQSYTEPITPPEVHLSSGFGDGKEDDTNNNIFIERERSSEIKPIIDNRHRTVAIPTQEYTGTDAVKSHRFTADDEFMPSYYTKSASTSPQGRAILKKTKSLFTPIRNLKRRIQHGDDKNLTPTPILIDDIGAFNLPYPFGTEIVPEPVVIDVRATKDTKSSIKPGVATPKPLYYDHTIHEYKKRASTGDIGAYGSKQKSESIAPTNFSKAVKLIEQKDTYGIVDSSEFDDLIYNSFMDIDENRTARKIIQRQAYFTQDRYYYNFDTDTIEYSSTLSPDAQINTAVTPLSEETTTRSFVYRGETQQDNVNYMHSSVPSFDFQHSSKFETAEVEQPMLQKSGSDQKQIKSVVIDDVNEEDEEFPNKQELNYLITKSNTTIHDDTIFSSQMTSFCMIAKEDEDEMEIVDEQKLQSESEYDHAEEPTFIDKPRLSSGISQPEAVLSLWSRVSRDRLSKCFEPSPPDAPTDVYESINIEEPLQEYITSKISNIITQTEPLRHDEPSSFNIDIQNKDEPSDNVQVSPVMESPLLSQIHPYESDISIPLKLESMYEEVKEAPLIKLETEKQQDTVEIDSLETHNIETIKSPEQQPSLATEFNLLEESFEGEDVELHKMQTVQFDDSIKESSETNAITSEDSPVIKETLDVDTTLSVVDIPEETKRMSSTIKSVVSSKYDMTSNESLNFYKTPTSLCSQETSKEAATIHETDEQLESNKDDNVEQIPSVSRVSIDESTVKLSSRASLANHEVEEKIKATEASPKDSVDIVTAKGDETVTSISRGSSKRELEKPVASEIEKLEESDIKASVDTQVPEKPKSDVDENDGSTKKKKKKKKKSKSRHSDSEDEESSSDSSDSEHKKKKRKKKKKKKKKHKEEDEIEAMHVRPLKNLVDKQLKDGFQATVYIVTSKKNATSSICTVRFDYERDALILETPTNTFDINANKIIAEEIPTVPGAPVLLKLSMKGKKSSAIVIQSTNSRNLEVLGSTVGWADTDTKHLKGIAAQQLIANAEKTSEQYDVDLIKSAQIQSQHQTMASANTSQGNESVPEGSKQPKKRGLLSRVLLRKRMSSHS
ncbi:hypothetical protein BdWA1_001870 [Babesia duncani]|uniref:Uncharacterized protein n=1 Tax=Babesia duncani TaxID=323732 RepID=A0AAD9PLF7_9APIC|nr:hypothetical protein BdWA1_001870 [Babesia duncani]